MIEEVKAHVRKHKVVYSCAVTTVVVAGITYAITKGRFNTPIGRDVIVTANRDAIVIGEKAVLKNVSLFSAQHSR